MFFFSNGSEGDIPKLTGQLQCQFNESDWPFYSSASKNFQLGKFLNTSK
jgi:hypothetical protein